ncbi:MAG: hypothetical protein NVS9B12_04470 [Vulcanimicrobiaceae bacterium]
MTGISAGSPRFIAKAARMFAITVSYLIEAGREDEALHHFSACIAASRAEDGNRSYRIYRSLEEPRRFFLLEEYDDEAAFEAHQKTEHFQTHIVNGVRPLAERRTADRCAQVQPE